MGDEKLDFTEELTVIEMTSRLEQQGSPQRKLWLQGSEALCNKKYEQAELFLLQALNQKGINAIIRHFVYNDLIKIYYALRDKQKDAIEKCIRICKEDISLLPNFLPLEKKLYPTDNFPPECPSLERLAIIYEKQGEIQKALEVCEKAIELGIDKRHEWYNKQYGAKKGYAERKKKLEKKLAKK